MTPDGRNSLRRHLLGPREKSLSQTWFQRVVKKETIPLFTAVGCGVLLASWFGLRHLSTSPDVQINKVKRQQTLRNNVDEAKNWVKHRDSLRNLANVVDKPAAGKQ